jgi:hypothetical protein
VFDVLLLHVAVTLAMVGLIWFVQVVHYPLMARVGRDEFAQYESDHQRLTTRVVAPLMLTEMATAVLLVLRRPVGIGVAVPALGFALLGFIWLLTFAVQVPQHARLASGFDARVQQRLVHGNWYRTTAWTARGLLVVWMVRQAYFSTSTLPGPN